jgi:drug/metabolite transporter (DMT)-like permease
MKIRGRVAVGHSRRPFEGNNALYGLVFLALRFVRVAGSIVLGCALVMIVMSGTGWVKPLDALVLLSAALVGAALWLELCILAAEGPDQRGKRIEANRKLGSLLILVAALWVGVNLVGNHLLN